MGGSVRQKYRKLNWNFQRGGREGILEKTNSMGEVKMFPGKFYIFNYIYLLSRGSNITAALLTTLSLVMFIALYMKKYL